MTSDGGWWPALLVLVVAGCSSTTEHAPHSSSPVDAEVVFDLPDVDAEQPFDAAAAAIDAQPTSEDAAVSLARWRPIAQGLEAPTDEGPVRGKVIGKTRAFLGIPYAKPPVGDLRFRPPAAPPTRSEPYDALTFGAPCMQAIPVVGVLPNSSEDCLKLNVWSPDPAPTSPQPVMVWIHGGAFQLGDGAGVYDGQKLSEAGGVVIVTLNYRLGAFGFLAHADFAKESKVGSSGNYGIRDQQAALAWVRANISAFGGDAENVTVFGESAGGHSATIHLASPAGALLFDKAIVQSGLSMKRAQTQHEAEAQGARFAAALGCKSSEAASACLRAKPTADLVLRSAALNGTTVGGIMYLDDPEVFFFQPTLDSEVMPRQLEQAFSQGSFHRVPVLHGATSDEGALFQTGIVGGAPISTREQFEGAMSVLFGKHVPAITAMYAPPANPNWSEALSQATGDFMFLCPARRMASYLHAHGVTNYLYRFTAPLESLLVLGVSGRAIHSADIPYVFGNSFELGWIPANKLSLGPIVAGMWTRFARSGDPNEAGMQSVRFPKFEPNRTDELNLDVPVALLPITKERECAMWEQVAQGS